MSFMGSDDLLRWAESAAPGDSIVYGRGDRAPDDVVRVIGRLSDAGALHPTRRRISAAGGEFAFQAQRGSGKISRVVMRPAARGRVRTLPTNRSSDRAVMKCIEAAVKYGQPCPTNAELARACGLSGAIAASYRVRRLIATGRISIIDHSPFGRRVVTMMTGRFAGQCTKEAAI
jgi:hypothetical protein